MFNSFPGAWRFNYLICLFFLYYRENMKCLPCRLRSSQTCLDNCPTRNFFKDEYLYRRALASFGYENIRKWMVEANVAMEGERCAQALKWEDTNRHVSPVVQLLHHNL
jgi:hypothetical protein